MPVGVLVGNLILQLTADVIIPVCFAGEAVIVIVVADLYALGHLGSGQPRRVGGDAVQIVADAVVGVLIGAEAVPRKAQVLRLRSLHDGHTVGGECLRVGVVVHQLRVQDAVVAVLQRVVTVGLVVEPDIHAQGVRSGFQLRLGAQGVVHRVRFLHPNTVLGVIAGRAPLADGEGQQRRRADDAEGERRAQHSEPVELDLHVGSGAVVQHLDAQHNEDDRREFQDLEQVEARHKLVDHQQHTGQNQHQRKRDRANAANLFRGGLFIHGVYSFLTHADTAADRRPWGSSWPGAAPAGGRRHRSAVPQ